MPLTNERKMCKIVKYKDNKMLLKKFILQSEEENKDPLIKVFFFFFKGDT